MSRVLDKYLENIRLNAETAAIENEKLRIQAQRDHEKFMKSRGGGRWDDLTLQDVGTLREDPRRYALLLEEEGFPERVEFLETELETAIETAKAVGDQAVVNATDSLPPAIQLLDSQEKERELFLSENGQDERSIVDAPMGIKTAYEELLKKHGEAIEKFNEEK